MKLFRKIKGGLISVIMAAKKVDRSKGSRLAIFCDIIYCKLRFHCKIDEYLKYKFYDYKNSYRKNFLLKYHQKYLYRRVNNKNVTCYKYDFYNTLSDLFQREVICAPECGADEFLTFVKKHKKVVIKPDAGSCGKGVKILNYENDEQVLHFFNEIPKKSVCEEFIYQNKVLSDLNPFSVNGIRVVSLRHDENNIEIISATLKSGAKVDSITDNLASGGIIASVDVETGVVSGLGVDFRGNKYLKHPITQVQFMGLEIPNWDKVISLVKKGHSRLNENKIVGWDIAVTESGADIIEGNSAPDPRVMQITDGIPKGEKILKILNNKKNYKYR